MNSQLKFTVALIFLAGLALGASLHKLLAQPAPAPPAPDPSRERAFEQLAKSSASLQTFPAVAALASESVVSILASSETPLAIRLADARGSGIVVDASGHILTNDHVIANATRIRVTLPDGREAAARVVGTDPATDIALLKVEAAGLVPARLGDSDALVPGEWVLAVGSPFGLANSVTAGIVSAKGRSGVSDLAYQGFIQTDAAVNPGNSGGPLVNLKGEVVGITSSIMSKSGGYDGISFAIPVNRAKSVMEELKTSGRVVRGYVGLRFADLNEDLVRWVNANTNVHVRDVEELRRRLKYGDAPGVFIYDVIAGGPAHKAGLRLGDLIVEFGGKPVVSQPDLKERIAVVAPGDDVEVVVIRGGQRVAMTVRAGTRPTFAR
jgi:serine protease Do